MENPKKRFSGNQEGSESDDSSNLSYPPPVQTEINQGPSDAVHGMEEFLPLLQESTDGREGNISHPVQLNEGSEDGDLEKALIVTDKDSYQFKSSSRNHACRYSKQIYTVVITFAAVLSVGGMFAAMFSPPVDFNAVIYQGDTILLDKHNGFWYSGLIITEQTTPDDMHVVQVFTENCSTLHEFVCTNHTIEHSHNLTVDEPLPVLTDKYLLSSSNISLNISVWNADKSNMEPELCIFKDKSLYDQFYSGDLSVEKDATECFMVNISPNTTASYTNIDYVFPTDSYYYIGVGFSVPLTLQYVYHIYQRYYNHSDFTSKCSATGTLSCKINLSLHDDDICTLAYTEVSGYVETEYVHLQKHLKRRIFNIVSLVLLVLTFVSFVGLLVGFMISFIQKWCHHSCCQ